MRKCRIELHVVLPILDTQLPVYVTVSSKMNNITYLDTSGLNFLADYIGDDDLFRFWKSELKIDFCISSIVLWEIWKRGRRD